MAWQAGGVVRISCDPGLTATGLALWGADNKLRLSTHFCGLKAEGMPAHQRVCELSARVKYWLEKLPTKTEEICVEMPRYFQGSVANASQDIVSLCLMTGALCQVFSERAGVLQVKAVQIADWKGTLPKAISYERTRTKFQALRLGTFPKNEHEADAVGIGMHHFLGVNI